MYRVRKCPCRAHDVALNVNWLRCQSRADRVSVLCTISEQSNFFIFCKKMNWHEMTQIFSSKIHTLMGMLE